MGMLLPYALKKPVRKARVSDAVSHKIRRIKSRYSSRWEVYLEALTQGYPKTAAAAIAGVTRQAPHVKGKRDPGFRAEESKAVDMGTARLHEVALSRIKDPLNPSDSLLKHQLGLRGYHEKVEIEHRHEHSVIPFSVLSPDTKRLVIKEIEEAKRKGLIDGESDDFVDVEYSVD